MVEATSFIVKYYQAFIKFYWDDLLKSLEVENMLQPRPHSLGGVKILGAGGQILRGKVCKRSLPHG